jgi:hypothetical protein
MPFQNGNLVAHGGHTHHFRTAFGSAAAATDEVCKKLIATGNPEYPPFYGAIPMMKAI